MTAWVIRKACYVFGMLVLLPLYVICRGLELTGKLGKHMLICTVDSMNKRLGNGDVTCQV